MKLFWKSRYGLNSLSSCRYRRDHSRLLSGRGRNKSLRVWMNGGISILAERTATFAIDFLIECVLVLKRELIRVNENWA